MPKEVKKGVGMMENTRLQYDLTAAGGEAEWKASMDHMAASFSSFDEKRNRIASNFRTFLKMSGLVDPCSIRALYETYSQYGEDTLEHLACKWLIEFHHVCTLREELLKSLNPKTLENLVERSVELGMLQERIWWRQGRDKATGHVREKLAVKGRKLHLDSNMGTRILIANSFQSQRGDEVVKYVDDLSRRRPDLSRMALVQNAAKKFETSDSTIKRTLKNKSWVKPPG